MSGSGSSTGGASSSASPRKHENERSDRIGLATDHRPRDRTGVGFRFHQKLLDLSPFRTRFGCLQNGQQCFDFGDHGVHVHRGWNIAALLLLLFLLGHDSKASILIVRVAVRFCDDLRHEHPLAHRASTFPRHFIPFRTGRRLRCQPPKRIGHGLRGYISSHSRDRARELIATAPVSTRVSGRWCRSRSRGFRSGCPRRGSFQTTMTTPTFRCVPVGTTARDNWPERGPTYGSVFQTLEGGIGYWAGNRFHYGPPKFSMNATSDCYSHEIASPGWPFFHSSRTASRRPARHRSDQQPHPGTAGRHDLPGHADGGASGLRLHGSCH